MRGTEAEALGVIQGASRLVFDAVEQVAGIVEGMHANITAAPLPLGKGTDGRARDISGLVYDSIRLVNRTVCSALDSALGLLAASPGPSLPQPKWDAVLAAVNGVLGDHLEASRNPLAIPMRLRRGGREFPLERKAIAGEFPRAAGKLLVLVHGLCMNDRQWLRRGHDHGEALARDGGHTPVYLHYNSGRHVSENGREFAEMLERLVRRWPVPVDELSIVAHSTGGLVTRSAHHYGQQADHQWPRRLRNIVFLGTPHHGTPLERGGNWLQALVGISPYTSPLSRLGKVRSAGVTDLRHGSLLDEDWRNTDRFERHDDARRPLPLPGGVACSAIAATTGGRRGDLKDQLIGDGLVPVASALGRHRDPDRALNFSGEAQWISYGANHWDLLDRPEVYEKLRQWIVGP